MKESDLQIQVAEYLQLNYPKVIFHSDYGSGVKLTPGQAKRQKRQNAGQRGWPDIFIAEPTTRDDINGHKTLYYGLFIELKREGVKLKRFDGRYATTHIEEQAKMLGKLLERGYVARFAVGFDEARKIIDWYLS